METLIYYLGLYALVFLLRFIYLARRVSKPTEDTSDSTNNKNNWLRIFNVSLDLVYTSAGFAIALIENLPNWIPAIMILYIFLVILSASVDTLTALSNNTRTLIHLIVVITVITITIIGYSSNFGKPIEKTKEFVSFKVIIPYSDLSLIKHAGLDFSTAPENNYRIVVKAKDVVSAKQLAIDSLFYCDKNYPLYGLRTIESKKSLLRLNSDEIIIMRLE